MSFHFYSTCYCRFLSVGDVFVIQCEDHDGQYCTKMMKVKKINNSNKTKQTYKINEYTSVFEVLSLPMFHIHRLRFMSCPMTQGRIAVQSFS